MRSLYRLLLSATLLLGACEKDDPEPSLPAITQKGLNTGGFLLNGVAYPATGWPGGFLNTAGSTGSLEDGYSIPWPGFQAKPEYSLSINSKQGKKFVTVTLFLRKPQVGEFLLNRDTGLPPFARDSTIFDHATVHISDGSGDELYSTSSRHTGRITMSVSLPGAPVNQSAGTFEFTAASTVNPNKTVKVSAGRFDRKQ